MGTWSHEPFGNDSACDGGYGLVKADDLSAVEAAMDAVIAVADDDLDSDLATEAIAAIEVLAKLQGRGAQRDAYTENIDRWVTAHPQAPSEELLQKARQVLLRVQAPASELLELWEDAEDAEAWKASLRQLAVATGG